jgi:type I restriction enzyme M protein
MHWIAPSEGDIATDTFENRLWNAADQLRAHSGLTAAQYSVSLLRFIFLLLAAPCLALRRKQKNSTLAAHTLVQYIVCLHQFSSR